MASLTCSRIAEILTPYLPAQLPKGTVPLEQLVEALSTYLDLLLLWNGRTNLTAIRDPEAIVERHFGESVFAGVELLGVAGLAGTLLDVGSGAGFPGLPIALLLPAWSVTLAESQGKKAAFLQEAVRRLSSTATVWPRRVELLPAGQKYGAVTLRAVDDPVLARTLAGQRLSAGGWLCELTGTAAAAAFGARILPLPGSHSRLLRLSQL